MQLGDNKIARRVSSRREAVLVALWALVFAAFVIVMVQLPDPWTTGWNLLWVLAGSAVLVVVIGIGATRVRTIRPRHYKLAETLSALWAAIGCSLAMQYFADGNAVNVLTLSLASLIVAAPMLICAAWLWGRGQ